MKTKLAAISGITFGFLTLILLAHVAGIELSDSGLLVVAGLSLTSISTAMLLSDRPRGQVCSSKRQKQ